jgi:TonB family protein
VDITIKTNMSRFRSCYVKESRKFPGLAGRVDIKFILNKDGKVQETSVVSSSLKSPLVAKCVEQQLMGLQFEPQEKDGTEIVYPFVFSKQ